MRHPSEGWRINGQYDEANDPTETAQAYGEATGASITFYGIGFAVVAQITIYFPSLFLGHESLKYFFAILCFHSRNGVAHFLKFCSTGDCIEPNHLRLLLLFGEEVSSVVVFQKAACGSSAMFSIWVPFDYREATGKGKTSFEHSRQAPMN